VTPQDHCLSQADAQLLFLPLEEQWLFNSYGGAYLYMLYAACVKPAAGVGTATNGK
jgi:hypothetical protein